MREWWGCHKQPRWRSGCPPRRDHLRFVECESWASRHRAELDGRRANAYVIRGFAWIPSHLNTQHNPLFFCSHWHASRQQAASYFGAIPLGSKPRFEFVFFERAQKHHWRSYLQPSIRSVCLAKVASSSVIRPAGPSRPGIDGFTSTETSERVWSEWLLSHRQESGAWEASIAFYANSRSKLESLLPPVRNWADQNRTSFSDEIVSPRGTLVLRLFEIQSI